jgi:hypothetical protein
MKYGVAGSDIIKQIHTDVFRSMLPDMWKVTLSEAIAKQITVWFKAQTWEVQSVRSCKVH